MRVVGSFLVLTQNNISRSLIESITIPYETNGKALHTFKVRKRRQNAHAIMNMAVLLGVDSKGIVLPGARIVCGGAQSHARTSTN